MTKDLKKFSIKSKSEWYDGWFYDKFVVNKISELQNIMI